MKLKQIEDVIAQLRDPKQPEHLELLMWDGDSFANATRRLCLVGTRADAIYAVRSVGEVYDDCDFSAANHGVIDPDTKHTYFLSQVLPLVSKAHPTVSCEHPGIVRWQHCTKAPHGFFATPFFDGIEGVPIDVTGPDGDSIGFDHVDYDVTWAPAVDAEVYFRVIKKWSERS